MDEQPFEIAGHRAGSPETAAGTLHSRSSHRFDPAQRGNQKQRRLHVGRMNARQQRDGRAERMIAGPLCLDTGKSLGTLLFESRTFEDDKPCRGSLAVSRRRHFMHTPSQNASRRPDVGEDGSARATMRYSQDMSSFVIPIRNTKETE
jgi:hypothetical protein